MSTLDIRGLDRATVLVSLYTHAHQAGFGVLDRRGALPLTREQAAGAIEARAGDPYFDYLRGRVLKVHLAGDEIDLRLYERDNGPAAVTAVAAEVAAERAAAGT